MKALGWIFLILVVLIGGAVAYVVLNSGNLVKAGIEEFGPQYLGVDVKVNEVNLALAEGSAQVKGLSIGNPPGFAGDKMMGLQEIKVVLDTNQISETLIVLKEVVIDGAEVAAVAKGQRTNFQQLMDNLEKAVGGPADDSAAPSTTAAQPKFIIDSFRFTNANASLSSDILGDVQLALPDISLQEIGRKSNGLTGAEVAEQLLKPISAAISKEAVNQGLDIDGVKDNVREKIRDKIGSGLRGLTDRLKKN